MASGVSLTSASTVGAASGSITGLAEDFNQFLNLLTVQLQNQDPLDPLDSNEFTNQLVQFTQAEQLINQNQNLEELISLQASNATSSALSFVGLDVSYLGNRIFSDGQSPQEINYGLSEEAAELDIFIRNDVGEIVRTLTGPTAAGSQQVIFDGLDDNGDPLEEGLYTVEISAIDQAGNGLSSSIAVTGLVTGIENVNGQIDLVLEGNIGLPISNVLTAQLPLGATSSTLTQDSGDPSDTSTTGDTSNTSDIPDDSQDTTL